MDIILPPIPKGDERTLNIAGHSNILFHTQDMEFVLQEAMQAQRLMGKVFQSDNATRASGAYVLYFEPGYDEPQIVAVSDALGNLQTRTDIFWNQSPTPGKANDLAEPVIIAFLPGGTGATFLPPPGRADDPMRIVLPPPISLGGEVRVGDEAPSNLNATVHVKAAYQGKGVFNKVLSVQTTADVDGRFTLAGLTPGDYLVQAALDDIWLSPSKAVHVSDHDPEPIELDIAAPGAPVVVKLVDRAGKPIVGQTITIDRPAGPLTETFWAHEWTSDGAGVVNIPTLEAGKHMLRSAESPSPQPSPVRRGRMEAAKSIEIEVPALPAKGAVEVTFKLDVDAPK